MAIIHHKKPVTTVASNAVDDKLYGLEDQALVIDVSTLLKNDIAGYQQVSTGHHWWSHFPSYYKINIANLHIVSVQDAQHGTVSLNYGKVSFIPEANYNGPAQFTYTLSDGKGFTDKATVQLSIAPVNDAPDAKDDSVSGNANNVLVIAPNTLLANDSDIDGDAITGVSIQNAVNGTVTWDGANVLFTPTQGYSGVASFTYTITDGKGAMDTATVNLIIAPPVPVNTSPDAKDDNVSGNANTTLIIAPATLLANDSDIDGDAITGVSIQNAVNGTVTWDGANVLFTPTQGYSGAASFTYMIQDSKGAVDTATVNLTIAPPVENTAPVAGDDGGGDAFHVNTTTDQSISPSLLISTSNLLSNDHDVNGDKLNIVSVQDALNGTISLQEDGRSVVFFSTKGYQGPASFTYTVSDGKGGFDIATVNLTVGSSSNLNPIANDYDIVYSNRTENDLYTLPIAPLLANDIDPNGDELSFIRPSEVGYGSFNSPVNYADGEFTQGFNNYNDKDSTFRVYNAGYTMVDNHGGINSGAYQLFARPSGSEIFDGGDAGTRPREMFGFGSPIYDEILVGNNNNDVLSASKGNDTLYAGAGNDTMTGGIDNDTFMWKLSDISTAGIERDAIKDFGNGQDVLNLKDLLIGESSTAESLDNYLHFSVENGNTVISISTQGTFADGNQSGGNVTGTIDQQIVINNDATAGNTLSDNQILQNVLGLNYKLLVTD